MKEINLLPQREKEFILKEEKLKIILILGFSLITALISFSLILLSIKIYLLGEIETQKILLFKKETEPFPIKEIEEKIASHNLILSQLNSFYKNNFSLSKILEDIFQALPQEIYLTNLNTSLTTLKDERILEISLSGFSPKREVLLEFKKSLESKKSFKDIYFPPSSWIKAQNINFSVDFKVPLK